MWVKILLFVLVLMTHVSLVNYMILVFILCVFCEYLQCAFLKHCCKMSVHPSHEMAKHIDGCGYK